MKKLTVRLFILVFLLLVPVLGLVNVYQYYSFRLTGTVEYTEWGTQLDSKLETDIASAFYRKLTLVDLNGAVRNLLGQQEMNLITKLDNGKLILGVPESGNENLEMRADRLAALRDYLAAKGTEMLFVACPYEESNYDPQLPAGVTDYANDNCNRFLPMLEARGIDTMDIRAEMHSDGIDHYDMMYRTDHHWTTEAGMYTYNKLKDYLVAKTGCDVDERVGDPEYYTATTWPKHHLGYYGQRTGRWFAGIDDFTLYTPQFDTLIEWVAGERSGQGGRLEDAFYDLTALETKDYSSRYTYDLVLGGMSISENRIVNHLAKNDLKVLVVSNSFYKAVCPFMITAFRDVSYIHESSVPRMMTRANMDISDFDAVIFLYELSIIGNDGPFTFLGE
ncbi:MAG: hypothetical protein IJQ21_03720 [Lachnospiraceae bacterium]|nr:hypothetical protein [Lachnospiraceae bacterium]